MKHSYTLPIIFSFLFCIVCNYYSNGQTTFANSSSVTIKNFGTATPYPSVISVSGNAGPITHIKVTINNFSHDFPENAGILLVAPNNTSALLLQDGCDDGDVMNNVTYSFDDDAISSLPHSTAWTTGNYKPTSYYIGDYFPSPAPGSEYFNPENGATFANTFNGLDANGSWSLYVMSFAVGATGSISGGWSITISTGTVTQICPGSSTIFTSNITGTTYQWQQSSDSINFSNISDNATFSGTNTVSLDITNAPSTLYNYEYRCVVNGVPSKTFVLRFINTWTGNAGTAWENALNWSCNAVPDANSDVVINGGTVIINSTVTIRGLTLASGVSLKLNVGRILNILH
ncbi:MAG: hypothetical protein H0W12_12455 [Chitinophagaceae bacterium]|nr:hypothetical protein [Chitinophagaceae bacterium]